MNRSIFMAFCLISNSVFTSYCGIILLLSSEKIGDLLGLQLPWLYYLLSAFFLVFSANYFYQVLFERISAIAIIVSIFFDFLMSSLIIASVFLMESFFTVLGSIILFSISGILCLFGALKLFGVKRLFEHDARPGFIKYCIKARTNAPSPELWSIIRSLKSYAKYSSRIVTSRMVSENSVGLGSIRECVNIDGKVWQEQCIDYKEGRNLTMRILKSNKEFLFPVSEMTVKWEIQPYINSNGISGTDVRVSCEIQPEILIKFSFLKLLFIARRFENDFPIIISKMVIDAKFKKNRQHSSLQLNDKLLKRLKWKVCYD